jgi:hypothetical protein
MNVRRLAVRSLLLLAAVALVVGFVVASSRRIVAADIKGVNGVRYGYQLDSYRFRNRRYLRLWNSSGMSLEFDLPGYYPSRVEEVRWLAADGAIYLRLAMGQRDGSGDKTGTMRLLFDFRSGELTVSCPLALWRIETPTNPTAWISDQQFEAALAVKSGGR